MSGHKKFGSDGDCYIEVRSFSALFKGQKWREGNRPPPSPSFPKMYLIIILSFKIKTYLISLALLKDQVIMSLGMSVFPQSSGQGW